MIIQDIYTGRRYVNNIPKDEQSSIIIQYGDRYMIVAKSVSAKPYSFWYNKT